MVRLTGNVMLGPDDVVCLRPEVGGCVGFQRSSSALESMRGPKRRPMMLNNERRELHVFLENAVVAIFPYEQVLKVIFHAKSSQTLPRSADPSRSAKASSGKSGDAPSSSAAAPRRPRGRPRKTPA